MDDFVNLTISLGNTLYFGQWHQWKDYARRLVAGRVSAYRQSAAFGNQSLTGFFDFFQRTWNSKNPLPEPQTFGLVPLRPASLTQTEIINQLLPKAA